MKFLRLAACFTFLACGDSGSDGDGGAASGGAASGGAASGGAASGGAATGGSASGGGGEATEYTAIAGTFCAPEDRIGRLMLEDGGQFGLALYDKKDPWIGPPILDNDTCSLHAGSPSMCGECPPTEVCSVTEEICVPERRTIKDGSVVFQRGDEVESFAFDETLGGAYGVITIGSAGESTGAMATWDGRVVHFPPLQIPPSVGELVVTTEEKDELAPGALDCTWNGGTTGFVTTTIPINHHASGPTFTFCMAPVSAGAYHADAEMIDPLAVVTGLEFQGNYVVESAAVELPEGCLEFWVGMFSPNFP